MILSIARRGPGNGPRVSVIALAGAIRKQRRLLLRIVACSAAAMLAPQAAHAWTVTTIHEFGDPGYANDGTSPYGGLEIRGNRLWGTTCGGGLNGKGTVYAFKIANPSNYAVQWSFSGTDGECPQAGLLRKNGKLFGTTQFGGSSGNGTLFSISPNGFAGLYPFAGSPDGGAPLGQLASYGGYLWGTTSGGGVDYGTVFRTDTTGHNYTQIEAFAPPDNFPAVGLTPHNGYLYGVTRGVADSTAFKVLGAPPYTETTLHIFDRYNDGQFPQSKLLKVGSGGSTIFYGTLYGWGSTGAGAIFKMSPQGGVSILHHFHNPDGALPTGDLAFMDGKLFGTTESGGAGYGSVYEFDPVTLTETTIHSFTQNCSGVDGCNPESGLREFPAGSGVLYGTTSDAGQYGGGTIFRVDH